LQGLLYIIRKFVFLSLLSAPAVLAQDASVSFGSLTHDSALPVEISSQSFGVDQATGEATFTGDVIVIQGDMQLTAQTLNVIYGENSGEIDALVAAGGVVMTTPAEIIKADEARYSIGGATIGLDGNVVFTQSGNSMSGASMVVDLEAGTGRMSGRVRTILMPGN